MIVQNTNNTTSPAFPDNSDDRRCNCLDTAKIAFTALGSAYQSSISWVGSVLKLSNRSSFYEYKDYRSQSDRKNNLNSARVIFPSLQPDDFVLTCTPKQTIKFHSLFARHLFKNEHYADVQEYMKESAMRFCEDVSFEELENRVSLYLAENSIKLLCGEAADFQREELLPIVLDLASAFEAKDPYSVRTNGDACVSLMLRMKNSLAFRMLNDGYSKESIAITFGDLYETAIRTPKILFFSIIENLSSRRGMQNELRDELASGSTLLLDKIIIESLRTFPPVPVFGPQATDVQELGRNPQITGYLHRDPDIFDPHAVANVPEHFKLLPFNPFGKGPNSCPFSRFVRDQTKILMTELFTSYSVQIKAIKRNPGQSDTSLLKFVKADKALP